MSSKLASPRAVVQETTKEQFALVHRPRSAPSAIDEKPSKEDQLEGPIRELERKLAEREGQAQSVLLERLGTMLHKRFERTGSLTDENRAIEAVCQAIDATPAGHPDQALYLGQLSKWLRKRSERINRGPDSGSSVEVPGQATEKDVPTMAEAPEGETIYANTPQHHGTVLLLQMTDEPSIGSEG